MQPKLKKRFGETNIKNKEKPGDLNSLLVLSLKHLFLKKALKNYSLTDISLDKIHRMNLSLFWQICKNQHPKFYSVARRVAQHPSI